MGKKIAFVGAGAVGGYTGAHMVQAGEDVTFIDPWPDHVEHMRKHGLRVTHAMTEPEFTVPVRALHVTDAQQLAKEKPVDIAFVCMKSYDTAWAAMLIRQYLAADGYEQQLAEGWFQNLEQVPERAITLTIPTILRVPKLIVSVPGPRKAYIVRQMLAEPISTACPATILRTHPDATVYLDDESAAEL